MKRAPTEKELEQREEFKRLVEATKNILPIEATAARELAEGSKYTWRDVVSLHMVGKFITLHNYGEVVSQYNLDILGDQPGMIVIRTVEKWIALPGGDEAKVLTMIDGLPSWEAIEDAGITELTGDITAGPGSGSQIATLADTGVTPGTYTNTNLIVDSAGRLLAAASGTDDVGIEQLTGDVTAGPGSGSVAATLAATGVAAGSYTAMNATVDAKGRLTAASNGSVLPGAAAVHPGYRTGAFYTSIMSGLIGSAGTVVINTLYAAPIYIGVSMTIATARVRTGNGVALSNAEIGIYSNAGGIPDQLVADFGAVTTTAGGEHTISGLSQVLTPGWYWLVCGFSGAVSAVSHATANALMANYIGLVNTLAANGPYLGYTGSWTFSAGNLPATFPSPARTFNPVPAVFLTV